MSHELPNLTFAPGFARIKTARNQIANFEFAQTRSNIYALPFIASYEADIFLKNHDKTKAAKMEKQSAEYEEKAANISIANRPCASITASLSWKLSTTLNINIALITGNGRNPLQCPPKSIATCLMETMRLRCGRRFPMVHWRPTDCRSASCLRGITPFGLIVAMWCWFCWPCGRPIVGRGCA